MNADRVDLTNTLLWLMLIGFGSVMIISAVTGSVRLNGGDLMFRQGLYVGIALLAYVVALLLPMRFWEFAHRPMMLLAIAFCAVVLLPGIGDTAGGAQRWIRVAGFSIQPAEIAKFAVVLYMAGYLARFEDNITERGTLLRPLMMVGGLAALLLVQPDFGTVVVCVGVCVALLFLAGARMSHVLLLVMLGGVLLRLVAYASPYRVERLITFLDPWPFATQEGYQLVQSLIAFGRGEFAGLGLGAGVQKLDFLPEAHNDFIYAVVAEELGLIGALLLLVLLSVLVLRMLRAARATGDSFARYLGYGAGLLFGIQVLINVGVNVGLLPTKGLTMPFVSYGGNSLIICCALFGMSQRAFWEHGDVRR